MGSLLTPRPQGTCRRRTKDGASLQHLLLLVLFGVVTPEGGAPEGVLFDVTAATVPGLVTVAGVLDATAN